MPRINYQLLSCTFPNENADSILMRQSTDKSSFTLSVDPFCLCNRIHEQKFFSERKKTISNLHIVYLEYTHDSRVVVFCCEFGTSRCWSFPSGSLHCHRRNLPIALGWGLLSQFPPFRHFPTFSASPKYMLAIVYHIHIWQVLPQLSCGDTCQIWMWCK